MSRILRKWAVDNERQEISVRSDFAKSKKNREPGEDAAPEDLYKQLEQMKADAQKQALQIIAEANRQREQLHAAARKEGYEEGYEAGLQQGQEAGEQLRQQAKEVLGQARDWLKDLVDSSEEKLIDLAVDITAKLVRAELELSPERILSVAQEALQKVRDCKTYLIYVHPADAELLKSHKDVLLQDAPEEVSLRIIADKEITPGGCLVDTDKGQVEVTIEGQLERLRQLLLGRDLQ